MMFLHLLLRAIDIVFIVLNVLFKNKDLEAVDVLFGLYFLTLYSATFSYLLAYFYCSEEIIEVLNNTLTMDYQMSKFDVLTILSFHVYTVYK